MYSDYMFMSIVLTKCYTEQAYSFYLILLLFNTVTFGVVTDQAWNNNNKYILCQFYNSSRPLYIELECVDKMFVDFWEGGC